MTQNEQVLEHMERYGSIDPKTALNRYSIFRLAARIQELEEVVEIKSELCFTPHGKRYAKYSLA